MRGKIMNTIATYFLFFSLITNASLHSMNEKNKKAEPQTDKVYLEPSKCPWNRLYRVKSQEEHEEKEIKSGIYREYRFEDIKSINEFYGKN